MQSITPTIVPANVPTGTPVLDKSDFLVSEIEKAFSSCKPILAKANAEVLELIGCFIAVMRPGLEKDKREMVAKCFEKTNELAQILNQMRIACDESE